MWIFAAVAAVLGIVVILVVRESRAGVEKDRKKERLHRDEDARDALPERPRKPRRQSAGKSAKAAPKGADGDASTDAPEGDDDFVRALTEFAVAPGAVTYRRIFDLVVAHPSYSPYSDEIHDLTKLYEDKRHDDVAELVSSMMPNWLLTPSVHKIACLAAKHRGDDEGAAIEMKIAVACIRGILASGEGTREAPYLVARVRDEYEVLSHLEKQLKRQSLVQDGERSLDCLKLTDGGELWFDITAAKRHLQKQMERLTLD